jgi:Family of unknown function (DUF6328)
VNVEARMPRGYLADSDQVTAKEPFATAKAWPSQCPAASGHLEARQHLGNHGAAKHAFYLGHGDPANEAHGQVPFWAGRKAASVRFTRIEPLTTSKLANVMCVRFSIAGIGHPEKPCRGGSHRYTDERTLMDESPLRLAQPSAPQNQFASPYNRTSETSVERIDRNWSELLQELRVTQTGVQILSGFLLTLPFQQRLTTLTDAQRTVFLVAISLATLATCLLVAPVSSHRLLFHKHEKDVLVRAADLLAKAGLAAFALTVVTVLLLIFSVVMEFSASLLAATLASMVFIALWVALPLALLRSHDRQLG